MKQRATCVTSALNLPKIVEHPMRDRQKLVVCAGPCENDSVERTRDTTRGSECDDSGPFLLVVVPIVGSDHDEGQLHGLLGFRRPQTPVYIIATSHATAR